MTCQETYYDKLALANMLKKTFESCAFKKFYY